MTGASGAGYGYELLRALQPSRGPSGFRVVLTCNERALSILEEERGIGGDELRGLVDEMVFDSGMEHELASGSNSFDAMIICPCSSSTASKIRAGIADNLTTRCASVAMKERRRLVLVVRETPLSTPVLGALYDLSKWGVVIMPASPPFYGLKDPTGEELQRNLAGRIMDIVGLENDITSRYRPGE